MVDLVENQGLVVVSREIFHNIIHCKIYEEMSLKHEVTLAGVFHFYNTTLFTDIIPQIPKHYYKSYCIICATHHMHFFCDQLHRPEEKAAKKEYWLYQLIAQGSLRLLSDQNKSSHPRCWTQIGAIWAGCNNKYLQWQCDILDDTIIISITLPCVTHTLCHTVHS